MSVPQVIRVLYCFFVAFFVLFCAAVGNMEPYIIVACITAALSFALPVDNHKMHKAFGEISWSDNELWSATGWTFATLLWIGVHICFP